MPITRTCPQCGAELAADAPAGLCPKCLVKVGIGSDAVVADVDATRAASATPLPLPATSSVPSLADIAKCFPQLEILELLGAGGMGVVYKARQRQLDRLVALKIMPPEAGRDPAFAERFTREARALARLNHPNIVAVYEFGQSDEFYYFIMEFVDGDIKPGNILIDKRGRVKIADFGLAKLLGKESADFTLTGSQQVMGTPH